MIETEGSGHEKNLWGDRLLLCGWWGEDDAGSSKMESEQCEHMGVTAVRTSDGRPVGVIQVSH